MFYGLLMCLTLAVCLFIMEITGQNQTFDNKSPLQILYMFLAPAFIWYFGIRAKKKMLKGKISFKQAFTQGVKISLVYGIVSPFIFLFYYVFINPEIVNYAKTAYGMTGSDNTTVIIVDMIVQFIAAIAFGSIYAAIISFFLKSKSAK